MIDRIWWRIRYRYARELALYYIALAIFPFRVLALVCGFDTFDHSEDQ